MAFDFDPCAVLADLRKNSSRGRGAATVATATVATATVATDEQTVAESHCSKRTLPISESELEGSRVRAMDQNLENTTTNSSSSSLSLNSTPAQGLAQGESPSATVRSLLQFVHVAIVATVSDVATVATVSVHAQLKMALARELWRAEGERTFLIDTSLRVKMPLLEQVPDKIDPAAWRQAVVRLSDAIGGQHIRRSYDSQPTITLEERTCQQNNK